jgi:thioredoxin reductase (NADPH)
MPRMTGIELLAEAQSRGYAAGAKRVLLTAYADTDVAIQAINDIGLDHYLMKPWDPPEERLFPVLDDLLGDWHNENPDLTSDVRVVDHSWSERGYEVKTILARNHVPYRWFDVELAEHLEGLLAGGGADDAVLAAVAAAQVAREGSRDLLVVVHRDDRGSRHRSPQRHRRR